MGTPEEAIFSHLLIRTGRGSLEVRGTLCVCFLFDQRANPNKSPFPASHGDPWSLSFPEVIIPSLQPLPEVGGGMRACSKTIH